MENDTLRVEVAKSKVICKHKEKIERQFSVQIAIDGYEENSEENEVTGFCTCQVVSKTTNAQENVDKAKSYIQALTASGRDFSIISQTYDANVVSKVSQIKSDLEIETGVVIMVSEKMNSVSIQGDKHAVEKAKKFIDSLSLEKHNGNMQVNYKIPPLQNSLKMQNQLDREGLTSSFDLFNSGNDSDKESSDDDIDDEGDEILEQEIKNSPDYQGKLEFAFKLGYHEADLVEALKKLDRDAGQNELLSELIKNSALRQDDEEDEMTDSGKSGKDTKDGTDIQDSEKKIVEDESSPFKHIIVDGSNVAMSHGNKEMFSCMGIKLAVDWFRERGHTGITVFVPQWRKETSRTDSRIRDQYILNELEREKVLVFTPSRRIGGKRVICYDDRYILKLAVETDGIVVSNDNYRDLIGENEQFKKVVEERLLMYSFVNDRFMPPDDPLGRSGPTLDNFLMKEPAEPEPLPPPCPYGSKKCTYGNKCKYYHPERRTQPHKSITEKLAEQAKQRMLEMRRENSQPAEGKKKLTRTKTPLQRTQSNNAEDIRKRDNSEEAGEKNKENKLDDYNQKLSESLLKMELDRALNDSDNARGLSPRSQDGRDFSPRSKLDQPDRSSPRLFELKQRGRASPRGNSPINLVVPGQSEQTDEGEKFLSGHLLLAKKLSDEANESDKLKKKSKPRGEDGQSSSTNKFFTNSSEKQKPELVRKQPLARVGDKQKLSRQLSLQGGEDPRLGRVPLHAQLSYDPRRLTKDQQFVSAALNQEERQKMLQDFMHVQRQDMIATSERGLYGMNEHQSRSMAQDLSRGHATLGRMQSAPNSCLQNSPTPRHPPAMTRQNSSSDTQLNKMMCTDNDIQVDGVVSRGPSDNLPMRDTTGSVTFQIGGQANQNLPQYRPLTPTSHCYSPISPLDYRYQQTMSPDYQHQGSHFLASNQMIHPHQQSFNHIQTPFHYPSANVPFLDHSNVWTSPTHVPQNVAGFPQQFVPRNMSPYTIPNQDINLQHSSTSNIQMHNQPVPVEMPILPNNPRFRLYSDLCNLFPEETVRMVMNQHPEEDNPKQLCAYILSYPSNPLNITP